MLELYFKFTTWAWEDAEFGFSALRVTFDDTFVLTSLSFMFNTIVLHFPLWYVHIRAVPSLLPDNKRNCEVLHHWIESTWSSCSPSSNILWHPYTKYLRKAVWGLKINPNQNVFFLGEEPLRGAPFQGKKKIGWTVPLKGTFSDNKNFGWTVPLTWNLLEIGPA